MHPYAIKQYKLMNAIVTKGTNDNVLIESDGKTVNIRREDLSPLCTALEGILRYFEFLEREENDREEEV